MNRIAVLVDAGYLLGQAVQILSSKVSRSRGDLKMNDPLGLIQLLISKATSELQNQDLLRVYWYDGVANSLSAEHRAIVDIDDVQLRAGTINGKGQQKGVDSKIVTDLIELATNHAISDAMVVTGDGDLAIGLEIAQRRGVRVAVMGVEEPAAKVHHSQSFEVTSIADRVLRIRQADIAPYLAYVPRNQTAVPATSLQTSTTQPVAIQPSTATSQSASVSATPSIAPVPSLTIDAITTQFINAQVPPISKSVVSASGNIDAAVDGALLYCAFKALHQGKLTMQQKNEIRASFRRILAAQP